MSCQRRDEEHKDKKVIRARQIPSPIMGVGVPDSLSLYHRCNMPRVIKCNDTGHIYMGMMNNHAITLCSGF